MDWQEARGPESGQHGRGCYYRRERTSQAAGPSRFKKTTTKAGFYVKSPNLQILTTFCSE